MAQSRELGQMHHEDRAGVNALIRGVDYLVMCTNRLEALDHAVPIRRRKIESLTDELLVEYGIAELRFMLPLADTKAHRELRRKALDRDSQLTAPGSSIPGEPMAGRAERSADAEGPYETKNCGSKPQNPSSMR